MGVVQYNQLRTLEVSPQKGQREPPRSPGSRLHTDVLCPLHDDGYGRATHQHSRNVQPYHKETPILPRRGPVRPHRLTYQNAKIVIQDPQNDRPAVHEARGKLIHVLILVCGPLLDNGHGGTAQFRMLFCLGFLLMGMDLLGDLRTRGKTFADSFGERILERTT